MNYSNAMVSHSATSADEQKRVRFDEL